MPERTSYPAGAPCWIDLAAPDLEQAIGFYQGLFGWNVERGGEEVGYYSMCQKGGKNITAIMPMQPNSEQPAAWNVYLASDDVDATAAKARDGGAQIVMEPMDVMEEGRLLFLFDPTGAAIGFWQARHHTGTEIMEEAGAPCWFELRTRDAKRADEFYGSLFPYTFEQIGDTEGFDYATLSIGGKIVGGRLLMGSDFPGEIPPHWAVYFAVDDTDASARKATELGGRVVREPADSPHGRVAAVQDPAGAIFAIIKPVQAG